MPWEFVHFFVLCLYFAFYLRNSHAFSNPNYLFAGCPFEGEAPPPGYVCRICHIPGHFSRHCPSESKPPPPGYICHKCGVPGHFIHSCPNYGDRKYNSRRTSSLIPIVSTSFDDGIPGELVQAISSSVSDSLPPELYCPLCKKVMTDAMLTSKCCYDSFCDKCKWCKFCKLDCMCIVEIFIDSHCNMPVFII